MIQWTYFICLIVSILGLGLIDHRLKIAVFKDRKRALLTILTAVLIFIVWDILGIILGIFFHGQSSYALPYRILPEFPIEELLFLILLSYVTLLSYLGFKRYL